MKNLVQVLTGMGLMVRRTIGKSKGPHNQQDYGMRIYDPRLGRFLSVNPIADQYPSLTPYQFASNQPIESVDMDGKERFDFRAIRNADGMAKLQFISIGPDKETLPFKMFGVTLWTDVISILSHIRVEYNNQHYIFADGGMKGKAANIPAASAYSIGYDKNVHAVAEYKNFLSDPDNWVRTHQSLEQGIAVFEGKMEEAALLQEVAAAMERAMDEEASIPPIGFKPKIPQTSVPKRSTGSLTPATQQKAVSTPNLAAKQNLSTNNAVVKPPSRAPEFEVVKLRKVVPELCFKMARRRI